jgi:predicted DNA-binding transcriptional regulator YafY
MSKRAYISRYLLIIKKLQVKPYSSFEEIDAHLSRQFQQMQVMDEAVELAFSKRTFQRDCKEIYNLFGVQIDYSTADKGYYINETLAKNKHSQRMIEEFEIVNSLSLANDTAPYIYLENRKPQGTDNLFGLLHAIKNKLQITFSYQKFGEETSNKRAVEPYALKEFNNRWYLMANNLSDGIVKSFALDRLTNLNINNTVFTIATQYNVEEQYQYCFGIINPSDALPEDIILSFDSYQGKYIKTLPLHHTQTILIDNEHELQIALKLFVTHDFIMELLSFGANVKVLQPQALINELKAVYQEAIKQY